MAEILSVGQFMFLKDIKGLLWLGIVDKVKTFLLCVNGDIFIPEFNYN
jgi:hypothetical protein